MAWYNATVDSRWHGRAATYLTAFTAKNIILIVFSILVVVERRLYGTSSDDPNYHPNDFWARIGLCLVPDSALTLITGAFLYKGRWHPIAALVTAIAWSALWTCGASFNALSAATNEVSFVNMDTGYKFCYVEAGLQAGIAVLYFVMIGFAGAAVHGCRGEHARRVREGGFEMKA